MCRVEVLETSLKMTRGNRSQECHEANSTLAATSGTTQGFLPEAVLNVFHTRFPARKGMGMPWNGRE